MSVDSTVIGSYAASALKFIDKVRLQGFRNKIFKSKIILESVTCLKNDSKFAKLETFINISVKTSMLSRNYVVKKLSEIFRTTVL